MKSTLMNFYILLTQISTLHLLYFTFDVHKNIPGTYFTCSSCREPWKTFKTIMRCRILESGFVLEKMNSMWKKNARLTISRKFQGLKKIILKLQHSSFFHSPWKSMGWHWIWTVLLTIKQRSQQIGITKHSWWRWKYFKNKFMSSLVKSIF